MKTYRFEYLDGSVFIGTIEDLLRTFTKEELDRKGYIVCKSEV